MTTTELISQLREADPYGNREVWLSIFVDGHRTVFDVAGSVGIDEANDVLIKGEGLA